MTEEAENKEPDSGRNIQVHVPPELEYHYRDIVNVFVGAGDVVLEMGNFHRSIPNTATISNRVVLSVATAYELHNTLGQALANAQQQLQQNLKK
ncbi:MAG: hypothetical protein ACI9LO_001073 [Planctomycetota bacterium]|jgi:hypothetical protein